MRALTTLSLACAVGVLIGTQARPADLDQAPIFYSTATPNDSIYPLMQKLKSGKVQFMHDDTHGYLSSLLEALKISSSSQVLVFSKTSFQRSRITPKTPRALYFNDEVTVGFCLNGDVLEISSADPGLGTTFYSLDQDPAQNAAITRHTDACLLCHASSANQGFPGHVLRSVSPDRTGEPVFSRGTKRVDHTTPFSDRWGGWYVTGTSGKQTHLGNKTYGRNQEPEASEGTNLTELKSRFTVANYLTPHSDLVALMVLEHQSEGHNRIARANMLVRLALAEQAELNKALGLPKNERTEGITRRIEWACEPLVEYLLFAEEAPLSEPVRGTSEFARAFATRGPFDSKGRSLRELDLNGRLFRHQLSYLIYTKAFDGLPKEALDRVYLRLWEILSGKDQSKTFAYLSTNARANLLAIVRETKQNLPTYWK